MLPVIMIVLWGVITSRSGFEWSSTITFLGLALLWFFLYPSRYDRNVIKYCEKTIDEGSYRKNFGEYELTLSESGLHSIAPNGESKFPWSSVDRAVLAENYLFIFLNGPIGYPIPIADIGRESSIAAYDFVSKHIENKEGEQNVTLNA
jgi:hypothetical protein